MVGTSQCSDKALTISKPKLVCPAHVALRPTTEAGTIIAATHPRHPKMCCSDAASGSTVVSGSSTAAKTGFVQIVATKARRNMHSSPPRGIFHVMQQFVPQFEAASPSMGRCLVRYKGPTIFEKQWSTAAKLSVSASEKPRHLHPILFVPEKPIRVQGKERRRARPRQ